MSGAFSAYYDKEQVAAAVERGAHRDLIGGLWDEIGDLQIDFLKERGLRPEHRLLDIGCGSLRLGIRAVDYLDAGNYWGTDLNGALLDAGYNNEVVPAGLAEKLPRSNLVVDEDFLFPGIPREMDFAIATSVFTHLPFNNMRLCLERLGRHLTSPCTFYFTVFTPGDSPLMQSCEQPKGGVVTHPHRDPYHYSPIDLHYAAAATAWEIEFIGDWMHPRNQMMVKATKS